MKITTITKVLKTAHHMYDGQGETIIYAKTAHSSRYRWFLGWGGGHRPVTKDELEAADISDIYRVPARNDGSYRYEEAQGFLGMAVQVYVDQYWPLWPGETRKYARRIGK
jgi:hypothetical protein